jgi:hypothetical protein
MKKHIGYVDWKPKYSRSSNRAIMNRKSLKSTHSTPISNWHERIGLWLINLKFYVQIKKEKMNTRLKR